MSLACNSLGQGFAWLEFNDLLGGDFQGSARGWVSTFTAARSVTSNAPKPISCTDLVFDQSFLDGFNETIEQRSGGRFGLACLGGHGINQFGFVHVNSSGSGLFQRRRRK
jgi:hypothetical protein